MKSMLELSMLSDRVIDMKICIVKLDLLMTDSTFLYGTWEYVRRHTG